MDKKKETEESIKAYREAAKADAWLFGDYDAYESYDINTKKVSEEDESVWENTKENNNRV